MLKFVALGAVAIALAGCTIDQTLNDLKVSAPVIRQGAQIVTCVVAPGAIDVAGAIEEGVAPSLVLPNNLARAGQQVACSRLTAR